MAEPSGVSTCPRCGAAFHCGSDDPVPCACSGLCLDAALLARLRTSYTGCLCLACLNELQQIDRQRRPGDGPQTERTMSTTTQT